ncbi:16S rRNA (cytosine(1402)-N(4))-methyltransferase RsmH [Falsiporphyromonas endometrii]|uniref:Ribosomal RNA small subunit methyltransferase H n=1 Tax=Falsiporphyromonas endometrii TaxID=1387297 RepID=A0ABV9KA36_9PORP|nr:16S rRNA (cytosine(1402)-N(4))-methyltransferase RsmH [Porphyromonadaceae bacterium]
MQDFDYHSPVLLHQSVDSLITDREGIYIDVTFGGGGHSRYILSCLSDGHLLGFDQDPDAEANCPKDHRFTFIPSNFRYLYQFCSYYGIVGKVDGILADLGVSSHQFDTAERGFSFRADEPAPDMRMNSRAGISAQMVLQSYSLEQLTSVFRNYGELNNAYRIAMRIVKARENGETFDSIKSLMDIVKPEVKPQKEKKIYACIFQALRIEVNDELGALRDMLEAAKRVLRPGGRLSVITYHSIEDRIVKDFFRQKEEIDQVQQLIYGNTSCAWNLINRKPIVPQESELDFNPRSRSAKLRIAEKL